MTLLDWKLRPRTMLVEIQTILEAGGAKYPTEDDCREWARQFIRHYVPGWNPGDSLTPDKARMIGSSFERTCARARRTIRRWKRDVC